MSDKLTPAQVAAKADWEGSALALAEWGLRAEDIDTTTPEGEELARAWALMRACLPIINHVHDILEHAPTEPTPEESH